MNSKDNKWQNLTEISIWWPQIVLKILKTYKYAESMFQR